MYSKHISYNVILLIFERFIVNFAMNPVDKTDCNHHRCMCVCVCVCLCACVCACVCMRVVCVYSPPLLATSRNTEELMYSSDIKMH